MSSASRTNVMATTPKRTTKPAVTESPGNWTHPRLREITRRRNATTFTDRNVRTITQNIGAIVALHALRWAVTSFVSLDIRASVAANAPASPYSPAASPLQGKGFNPTRNGRRSSFGSPSPLGAGSGGGNGGKLFEGMTSPSPSGKKTSVGLNSKWLYERGRRSSGSWMQ